jgi:ATP-dependent protease HslVU (ClpYQ) peptidase subunit
MTTLAAIQGDGWAVVGCDSRSTDDHGKPMTMITPKIIQNGNYLIAGAGASRGSNLLQFGWTPPKFKLSDNLDKFMTTKFIPSMRKLFLDAGYDMKEDGQAASHDSEFIIIANGVIYPVFSDYSWDRTATKVYYSGSGGHTALGAMEVLGADKAKTAEQAASIIDKAINTAIKWDVYSNGPVIIKKQFAR